MWGTDQWFVVGVWKVRFAPNPWFGREHETNTAEVKEVVCYTYVAGRATRPSTRINFKFNEQEKYRTG